MTAQIINRTEAGFTIQVTIPYSQSMLEFEETLQDRLNAAGVLVPLPANKDWNSLNSGFRS